MPPDALPSDNELEAHTVARDEHFEFLEPPWEVRNKDCLVKATNFKFEFDENGGLVSKYAALFDCRRQLDSLRVSFLRA